MNAPNGSRKVPAMPDDDEAQATAEEARGEDEAADNDSLPSGLTGEPPAEAAPVETKPFPAAAAPTVGTAVTPPANPSEAGAGSFGAAIEGVNAAQDNASQETALSDTEEQRLAQVKQDQEDENVRRQMDAQAQQDARTEYLARKEAADAKVRDFKFHDFYDDPKNGSRAVGAISAFLGGLGNLGGQNPGAQNQALETLEHHMNRDHDDQVSYLNSAKYFADKQREGVEDLLKQQQIDRHEAELDFANKKLATADKFNELSQTARGKQNFDAAQIAVAKLKKEAYDGQQKVFSDIAAQKLEEARANHQNALAQRKARGAGGGGAGRAGVLADFEEAAQAIKPGDPVPRDVYAKGVKAGFKLKDIQSEIDKARESGKKSLPGRAAATGELPKDAVVYGGSPIGLAPSGRGGAAGFEKSLIGYDDGLKSLEALKKYRIENPVLGRLARGDAYNRAVLAIAATTTANASDSTTKHEADTLRGMTFIDPDAIQTSIDHIRERRQALIGTLRPLPKSGDAAPTDAVAAPHVEVAKARLTALGAVRIE